MLLFMLKVRIKEERTNPFSYAIIALFSAANLFKKLMNNNNNF
jgi:hypothetical protein